MKTQLEIEYNCCYKGQEPDWSEFNGFELAGVEMKIEDGSDVVGRCEGGATPDFYTLYARLKGGGVEAIHDFPEGSLEVFELLKPCTALAKRLEFTMHLYL